MPERLFHQDPALSSGEVLLEDDRLIVIKRGIRMVDRREYSLRDIDSNPTTVRRHFSTLYLTPLVAMLLSLYFGWVQKARGAITLEMFCVWWILSLTLLIPIVSAFKWIETLQIKNLKGDVICEIYRPRKGGFRYDEFVTAFCARMRNEAETSEH
jgi:hypothetical protein